MSANSLLARPMSIGELLDRAITLYRNNFLPMIIIVAIVNVPYLVLQIIIAALSLPSSLTSFGTRGSAIFSDPYLSYMLLTIALALPLGIAYIFQHGALTVVASEFLLGRRASVRQAYGAAWRRGWSLFGAQFLLGLVNILSVGSLFCPLFALFGASAGLRSSSGSSAFLLAMLYICTATLPAFALVAILNIHWMFWPQAIMLETKGAASGLGRSWRLVRGSFWRIFFIAAMMYILIFTVSATPSYAISFATFVLPSPVLSTVLNTSVSILIGIFVTPLWYAFSTALYYDVRIRKEGFDLELQAQQLTQENGLVSAQSIGERHS